MNTRIAHNQFSQVSVTASERQNIIAAMAKRNWNIYREDPYGCTNRRESMTLITFIRKYEDR
jgi:hypothetical protein